MSQIFTLAVLELFNKIGILNEMSNTGYMGKEKNGASSVTRRTQILQGLATITVHLASAHIQLNVPVIFHN